MLRIDRDATGESITFRIEGKLLGPWVSEVRSQLDCDLRRASVLGLDLHNLSFVDEAGLALLQDLIAQGVQVTACSNYVAELLGQESN